MIEIYDGTYNPYEFEFAWDAYRYILSRTSYIENSIKRIEITKEHLVVKCLLSNGVVEVIGSSDDLLFIDELLTRHNWYSIKLPQSHSEP